MELTITTILGSYKCRTYFNDDNDNGIEVSINGNHIGRMFGMNLPDEDDDDEINEFRDELEVWLCDNE